MKEGRSSEVMKTLLFMKYYGILYTMRNLSKFGKE